LIHNAAAIGDERTSHRQPFRLPVRRSALPPRITATASYLPHKALNKLPSQVSISQSLQDVQGMHQHVSGGSTNVALGGVANTPLLSWRRYYSGWSDNEDEANATVPAVGIVNDDGGTLASWHLCNCNWCGNPNRLVQPPHQPHLYIVIDDWAEGFSIHKIDLENKNIVPPSQASSYQRLPTPAFRMEFSNMGANTQIAAVGSKIVACNQGDDGVTVVYDTSISTHSVLRHSPAVFKKVVEKSERRSTA
ncbi:hypothetical protein EJB05_55118, partial [Eragrostis curvula]